MKAGMRTKVFWIGRRDVVAFDTLEASLRECGLELEVADEQHDLGDALRDLSRLVVVVCGTTAEAEQAFAALRSQYRPIPVVILTTAPCCGDYYRFFGVGPTYFCTVPEASEPVRRVIQRAAVAAA